MTIATTNPTSGILSDQTNVPSGMPAGFPQSPVLPQKTGGKGDHELMRLMVVELRIHNFLLAQVLGLSDDLDQWRLDPGFNPDLYPLS
jgi:hypothetical protein